MRALLVLLVGCAVDDLPCAGRRDLTETAGGLVLTAAEHPQGWGRTECAQCHPVWTVHVEDCIDGVAVNVADIEPGDCVVCHGDNGVGSGGEP